MPPPNSQPKMPDLIEALNSTHPHPLIAVVGSGGKTSLCWQLIQAFTQRHRRALFTTTTRVWQPQANAFDLTITHRNMNDTLAQLNAQTWRSACVLGEITDIPNTQPIANSWMPVIATKRIGLTGAEVCQLHKALPNTAVIVEADGARGLLLKAPSEDEPVIPSCATIVCVVACLDAIGQPLDERTVHRPERFAALSGLRLGERIDAQAIGAVLCHLEGGHKLIPLHAKAIAVLTQHDKAPHASALWLLDNLLHCGFDRALLINPRVSEASAIAVVSA